MACQQTCLKMIILSENCKSICEATTSHLNHCCNSKWSSQKNCSLCLQRLEQLPSATLGSALGKMWIIWHHHHCRQVPGSYPSRNLHPVLGPGRRQKPLPPGPVLVVRLPIFVTCQRHLTCQAGFKHKKCHPQMVESQYMTTLIILLINDDHSEKWQRSWQRYLLLAMIYEIKSRTSSHNLHPSKFWTGCAPVGYSQYQSSVAKPNPKHTTGPRPVSRRVGNRSYTVFRVRNLCGWSSYTGWPAKRILSQWALWLVTVGYAAWQGSHCHPYHCNGGVAPTRM